VDLRHKRLASILANHDPEDTGEVPPLVEEAAAEPEGLVARGCVMRRQRKLVGEKRTEVVIYTLGPRHVVVEDWDANGRYHQIGEFVAWPVLVTIYNSKAQFRKERTDGDF
jgi:hypothetical protein